MKLFGANEIIGNKVSLEVTKPGHMKGMLNPAEDRNTDGSDFGSLVTGALKGANNLVQESAALTQQYITDPDSVDVHDVTIAMSEANLAVSMTKSVVDGALKAYKEIINIR